MKILFALLYLIDVTLCICAIKSENRKFYAFTKVPLMPLLLATYLCFLTPDLRTSSYQIYAIIALVLHSAGDSLLLVPKEKSKAAMYVGMISFFIGHIFYVLWFANSPFERQPKTLFVSIPVVLFLEFLFSKALKTGKKKKVIPLMLYSLSLGAFLITASMFTVNPIAIVSILGILLFTFSDFCIAMREIHQPIAGQLVVMPTYIAGQTLIVCGMFLLQIL